SRSGAETVGTTRGKFAVERFVSCWKPAKKNVLSLRTGPPTVNPGTLWTNTDLGVPFSLSRFETELKRCDWYLQISVPLRLFVPDLVTTLRTAPEARPNSELKFEVCTDTSSTASAMLNGCAIPVKVISLLSVPSSRKLLPRTRWPFTENSTPSPPPSSATALPEGRITPGSVRASEK